MLIRAVSIAFEIYSWLIIIRILMSWFPQVQYNEFVKQIYNITDPYLNIFKKYIPPLGMIDVSPIVAIFALELARRIILSILFYM